MRLLQSKRMAFPIIYLIENSKELDTIPLGVPFIRGNSKDYDAFVQLIEFEILLKSARATGLPFRWETILRENGYNNFFKTVARSEFVVSSKKGDTGEKGYDVTDPREVSDFLIDISYQVDIEYLKNLKVIPTWFGDIEEAVKENILNSITYNPNLYNKKLDLCAGSVDLTTPERNLIIIDISSSIPRSISHAILLLCKTMSTQFFADVLITGSKSTLYDYTEVDALDVKKVYTDNGTDNDQVYFKGIVEQYRKYNTVIVFGDHHSPSQAWSNNYNKKTSFIDRDFAKDHINKFEVKTIFSFHTTSNTELAGYGDWFTPSEIVHQKDWVRYLD